MGQVIFEQIASRRFEKFVFKRKEGWVQREQKLGNGRTDPYLWIFHSVRCLGCFRDVRSFFPSSDLYFFLSFSKWSRVQIRPSPGFHLYHLPGSHQSLEISSDSLLLGAVNWCRHRGLRSNERTIRTLWSPGLYSNYLKDICASHSWVELLDETLALEKSLEVLPMLLVGPVPSHPCMYIHAHTCTIVFLDLVPNPELIPRGLRHVMSLLSSYVSPCFKQGKCPSTLLGVLWEPPQHQTVGHVFREGLTCVGTGGYKLCIPLNRVSKGPPNPGVSP